MISDEEGDTLQNTEVSKEFLKRIPGGVFRYRADGDLELDYVNYGLIDIYGCDSIEDFRDLVGNNFRGMVHPDDYDRVDKEIWEQVKATNKDHVRYRIIRKDGAIRHIEDYGSYIIDPDGTPWFYVTILDVTDELLKKQTQNDALTKVLNRAGAESSIQDLLLENNGPCTFMIVDIDNFKYINDNFGHPEGDRVLQALADHMSGVVRDNDVVARLGGDEFVLFAKGLDEGEALFRIVSSLVDQPFIELKGESNDEEEAESLYPTISVGVAVSEKPNITLEELYDRADKALYKAKEFGKSKAFITTIKEDEDDQEVRMIRGVGNGRSVAHNETKSQERRTILIVDDAFMNRQLLTDILEDDYEIVEAEDGQVAVDIMNSMASEISLVVLDINMPNMDGFEVLEQMNRRGWIEAIPVIMISAESSDSYMEKAYELGATDYISRPYNTAVVKRRINNTIMLYAKQQRLVDLIYEQINEKSNTTNMMISILGHIVEFRNNESGMHVLNIGTITDILLRELMMRTDEYGLDQQDVSLIVTASALHDIGKISIDEAILNKPGRLTDEEFEHIKQHTTVGDDMLRALPFYEGEPLIERSHEIIRWHHERYDGRGYPDGLKGDEIPIAAQVVALADVYDALTSQRVYKPAFDHETAVNMILNGECGAFNPLLLECLKDAQDSIVKAMDEDYATNVAKRDMRYSLSEVQKKLGEAQLDGNSIKDAIKRNAIDV